MQQTVLSKARFCFLMTLCVAVGSLIASARAENQAAPQSAARAQTAPGSTGGLVQAAATSESRPYFIEFRSRNAANYGHAFVLYGRVGTKGKIAGLHPAGDRPDCVNCSVVAWTIGHLFPVPAETGASDGDDEPELYLTARYRVRLTAAQYQKLVGYIKQKQADTKTWNALVNNCVEFIGDIAEYMGLQKPSPIGIVATRVYVEELAKLNGGSPSKIAKLPDGLVRDAPASFAPSSASARTQRASVSN